MSTPESIGPTKPSLPPFGHHDYSIKVKASVKKTEGKTNNIAPAVVAKGTSTLIPKAKEKTPFKLDKERVSQTLIAEVFETAETIENVRAPSPMRLRISNRIPKKKEAKKTNKTAIKAIKAIPPLDQDYKSKDENYSKRFEKISGKK
jgi:hypothetical protein